MRKAIFTFVICALLPGCDFEAGSSGGTGTTTAQTSWEIANPVIALPTAPLGIHGSLTQLTAAPTPDSVRLGRWLFSILDFRPTTRFPVQRATNLYRQ